MKPPVSYQGGKTRLAKKIVDHLDYQGGPVCDLCCGCGAISLEFLACGAKPSDITMVDCGPWGTVWDLVGRGEFDLAKFKAYVDAVPSDPKDIRDYFKLLVQQAVDDDSPYVFLLIQAASFGGKPVWTEGGTWQHSGFRGYWLPTPTSSRRSPVNPMMPMPQTLLERMELICGAMLGVNAQHARVEDVVIDPDALVYIDPPYEGLTGYGTDFDVLAFVQQIPNVCWVSESRALRGGDGVLVAKGRAKGGVSGLRKKANEEWLTKFANHRKLGASNHGRG